jgi:hypothetical protein
MAGRDGIRSWHAAAFHPRPAPLWREGDGLLERPGLDLKDLERDDFLRLAGIAPEEAD